MRRSLVVTVLVLLVLGAAAPVATAHEGAEGEDLEVEPSSITAGESVVLAGSGLEPESDRVLVLVGNDLTVALGTVTTDAGGMFSSEIAIPGHLPAGSYELQAIGDETLRVPLAVAAAGGGAQVLGPADAANETVVPRERAPLELLAILGLVVIATVVGAWLVWRAERFRATPSSVGPRERLVYSMGVSTLGKGANQTMELTILGADAAGVRAGYSCPCGCTPAVEYQRGTALVDEGCCCGNQFAVGPHAAASLRPREGFHPELRTFQAPWGETLEAAWSIGPSVHGPDHGHDHPDQGHDLGDDDHGAQEAQALDPVCGMTVDRIVAEAKGLHTTYQGIDYFFCGKGCKLEFGDDPERFVAPDHVPSM